jgi:hypothetical protein
MTMVTTRDAVKTARTTSIAAVGDSVPMNRAHSLQSNADKKYPRQEPKLKFALIHFLVSAENKDLARKSCRMFGR